MLIESSLRGDIVDESNVKCRTCGTMVKLNDDIPYEARNWIFHIRACKEPRKLRSDTRLTASSSSFSSTQIAQGKCVKNTDRKRKVDTLLADEDAPTAMEQGTSPSSHPFVTDERVILQVASYIYISARSTPTLCFLSVRKQLPRPVYPTDELTQISLREDHNSCSERFNLSFSRQ